MKVILTFENDYLLKYQVWDLICLSSINSFTFGDEVEDSLEVTVTGAKEVSDLASIITFYNQYLAAAVPKDTDEA